MKVYWNSTRKIWSCVEHGRVRSYATELDLEDCKFRVSQAGRKRVVATGKKNVHAFVIGDLPGDPGRCTYQSDRVSWVRVRYNPYSMDNFIRTDTGEAVFVASRVFMDAHGQVFADLT